MNFQLSRDSVKAFDWSIFVVLKALLIFISLIKPLRLRIILGNRSCFYKNWIYLTSLNLFTAVGLGNYNSVNGDTSSRMEHNSVA